MNIQTHTSEGLLKNNAVGVLHAGYVTTSSEKLGFLPHAHSCVEILKI